jgi:hypothetical protein
VYFDAKIARRGLALLVVAAGCGGAPSGLTVTVVAGSDVARPTALSVSWISDRGTLFQRDEVPVAAGETLASIFIELDSSDGSDRRILVRGKGPGTASSIGAIRIRGAMANQVATVTLRPMMADGDGDGLPDVIDDCTGCGPADGGAPEDADLTPYPDGPPPFESDAAAPADASPVATDAAPAADAALPPIPNLVALWRMDEGTGTVARDSSPAGNSGTLVRPTGMDWGSGRPGMGTALQLTGTSWLSVPPSSSYDADGGLTLSAWVFWSKATSAAQVIMSRQRGIGLRNALWLGLESNRLHFSIEDEGVNVPMPAGRWVHVAGTYDGAKVVIYLDGAPVTAGVASSRPTPANRGISIGADINGADPTAATSLFEGKLDEIAIFDRALTAAEVATLAK